MTTNVPDEQKQRRAEASRENGRLSKGPVSPAGKYRSSMNAITTGQHVELHKADLPSFYNLISSDDREEYLRGLQAHYRKFKPDSEVEQGYVRRMVSEMFSFDRNTSLYTRAMQEELDIVLREYPDIDLDTQFLNGHKRSITQKELFRTIERNKKAHLAAYEKLMKLLAQSRKLFPLQPPEPIDELPPEQRLAFVQNEIEGIPFKDIKQTGVSVATLISRKRYAVLHLRERLALLKDELLNY